MNQLSIHAREIEKNFFDRRNALVGYIYRYWAYVSGKSSKQIYKLIKPDELRKRYFPYHSLDPQQAIDRIKEEIEPEEQSGIGDIAKGVIALRKVRNKRS